jgi:protocatechuate 4,5-dioxygenase beta chain|tara:strand:- start:1900 stop:2733 length:834 start_codon:yes stop_codon:yes gene_type:complete
MATIVGGFCVPHAPLITGAPDAPSPGVAERVFGTFAEVKSRIEALEADTVIVIGDDQCSMFHPRCLPRLLIGVGDIEGPIEPEPFIKIPRQRVRNNEPLAEHLMNFGFRNGFDWAVSRSLVLDHSTMVPVHLAVAIPEMQVIPIYISSGTIPLISGERCRQLGEMIGRGIAEWEGDERVVILGTGGISHWVGMAEYGKVNEEFDHKILQSALAGDVDALVALTDEETLDQAGNGALEIKNWIVAMAAMPDIKAEIMAYAAVEEWVTGMGFMDLAVVS